MITVYSKPYCPHCVAAKNYLSKHEIAFDVKDVSLDENALQFLRDRDHKSVPQLYVDDRLLVEGGNAGLQKLGPDEIRARVATLSK